MALGEAFSAMLLQTTLIIRLVTRGLLSEEDVLSLVDTTLLSLENLKDAERQVAAVCGLVV
jgi:hypothetical protein